MGRVDFDRNGTLDLEEFISGLIDWTEVMLNICGLEGMCRTSVTAGCMQGLHSATLALTRYDCMQLQKDGDWESRVDAAFAKLDSNGDGYIDLEELLAQLPFETEESYDGERLMEVV